MTNYEQVEIRLSNQPKDTKGFTKETKASKYIKLAKVAYHYYAYYKRDTTYAVAVAAAPIIAAYITNTLVQEATLSSLPPRRNMG